MSIIAIREDRREVHEVVWDVLATRSSAALVHQVVDQGTGQHPELDTALAELGWFGIDIPIAYGGGGGSTGLMQPVFEGCGWAAATTRILGTTAACAGALLHAGTDSQRQAWLPDVAAGSLGGAMALPDIFKTGRVADALTASPAEDGWLLSGPVPHVVDAPTADVVVALAHTLDGTPVLVVVEAGCSGLTMKREPTIDRTRSLGWLDFVDVHVPATSVLATGAAATQAIDAVVPRLALATASDSLGIATRVLETTTEYAVQRHQFGRAIGSFQAVKHQAADMLVRTEMARALLDEAADAVDDGHPDAPALASMAKAYSCETASWVAGRGIQLHGGIGYTWEHDMHIYLKRAKLNEAIFGDPRWHRERVAHHLAATGA